MGDFGINDAEVGGSACGFPVAGHKKKAKRLRYGSWRRVMENIVLQGAGTKPIQTYVDRRQATVSEWVALRNIFDDFARETGYEGGERLRVPW